MVTSVLPTRIRLGKDYEINDKTITYGSFLTIKEKTGFQTCFLATQISASKYYMAQNRKNVNLPKLVRGVSLLSFREFIEVWGYFDPCSANYFGVVCLQW